MGPIRRGVAIAEGNGGQEEALAVGRVWLAAPAQGSSDMKKLTSAMRVPPSNPLLAEGARPGIRATPVLLGVH